MDRLIRRSYLVTENDNGRRIDRIIRKMFPSLSLSAVYRMIRKGHVRIAGERVSLDIKAKTGDEILVMMKSIPERAPFALQDLLARDHLLRILVFENANLIALNKPKGLLTHGDDSLDMLVRAYLADTLSGSLSFTPGPVHRLDRNTTGLIVFAKNLKASQALSAALHGRKCNKYYICVFSGAIRNEVNWEDCLYRDRSVKVTFALGTGKPACTRVIPVVYHKNGTLAVCEILSGRTHQIRSQGAIHGHPLAGDSKYGDRKTRAGYILHSTGMRLPENDAIGVEGLLAGPPPRTRRMLSDLFGESPVRDAVRIVRDLVGLKET